MEHRPLAGVRVCELSIAIAAPLCGRYLAHFGADVIKVESERNPDVIRSVDRDTAPVLGEYNAGKRSVGLDLKAPEGAAAMRRLLAASDVFVTNYTASAIAELGLSYPEVAAVRPDVVYAVLPGFGSEPTAPYYDYVAWGPNQAPLVGLDGLTGFPGHDPAGMVNISYPDYCGGIHAAVAVLAELRRRAATGAGAWIDLSQMEAAVSLLGPLVLAFQRTGVVPAAAGNRQPGAAPQGVYPCAGADRWVAVTVTSDEEWGALARVAGHPEWARDDRLATADARAAHQDLADELVGRWTAEHTMAEIAHWLQRAGVPAAPVADNEAVALDPQLTDRRFWALAPHARVGLDLLTGVPVRLADTPGRFTTSAPPFAEHTVEVLRDVAGYDPSEIDELVRSGAAFLPSVDPAEPTGRPWQPWIKAVLPNQVDDGSLTAEPGSPGTGPAPAPRSSAVPPAPAEDDLALVGVRVVAVAGPELAQTIRVLSGLGADLVLVEPPGGGRLRTTPAGDMSTGAVEAGLWHASFAGGCRSVVVDLDTPDGAQRFRALAAAADVVLDTTEPGWLDRRAAGATAVLADNPSVVWVSVTAFGSDGPRRDWRGSDLVAWAGSGVLYATGHPDTPPVVPGGPALLACHLTALNAAVGTLVALAARERTGRGQVVDVSMQEAAVAAASELGVPLYLSDLLHRARQGNRRPLMRPWGLYPCRDGWASIVIIQPAHWDAIAAWMHERCGNDTAIEPMFRDVATRFQVPELMDQWAEELSATYTRAELFAEGQRRGVPVTPVTTIADLLADPHLAATGFWADLDDPELGPIRVPGPPWRLVGREWRISPAPALGAGRAEEPAPDP